MKRSEVFKAIAWALAVTVALAVAIVVGSRNLSRFDSALVAYTFASLFAVFGIAYRYSLWLQRPPTALYWRRGWQTFFKKGYRGRNAATWVKRVVGDFALNKFIWFRGKSRWLAHWLIMWGCIMAAAITFPLVFGWIMFQSVPGRLDLYRIYLFGFPTTVFRVDSIFGFILFHGLVWSAFFVIAGVMIAMRRRMRDAGAASLQLLREDVLPLVLLFAVSLTGLLLTVSYTWLRGYGYEFISLIHAVTVIMTLLWLPFAKFFHIFQRPAQLGVSFYKDVAHSEERAKCRRCGHEFASKMHVEDLIQVQRELGYRYESADPGIEHYQWICLRCRRALLALAQNRIRFPAILERQPRFVTGGNARTGQPRNRGRPAGFRRSRKFPSLNYEKWLLSLFLLRQLPKDLDLTRRLRPECGLIQASSRTRQLKPIAVSAASSAGSNC